MSIDEIDASLTALGEAVATQAANLLALENSPGRALLDPARLSGTSRAVANLALAQLAEVWRAFAASKDILDRASGLRAQRMDARRMAALDAMLHGCSVPEVLTRSRSRRPSLPRSRVLTLGSSLPRPTPVAAGHPPQAGGMLRPDELARRTDRALRGLRTTFQSFTDEWNRHLATLADVQRTIEGLVATAERIGVADEPGLAIARRLLTETAAAVAADPLAVAPSTTSRLAAAVAAAAASVGALARRHDGLDNDLNEAAELLEEIVRLAGAGQRSAEQAAGRVAGPGSFLRLEDGWLDDPRRGLQPWLGRLHALAAARRWREASVGLSRWRELAEATRATAAEVAETNGAALRRRDELRGLLGAWRSKAARLGLADHPDLVEAARRATATLYTAPTDVGEAARQVDAYAAALAAASARRGQPQPSPTPAPRPALAPRPAQAARPAPTPRPASGARPVRPPAGTRPGQVARPAPMPGPGTYGSSRHSGPKADADAAGLGGNRRSAGGGSKRPTDTADRTGPATVPPSPAGLL